MIYKNCELYNIDHVSPAEDGEGVKLCRVPEAVRIALNSAAASNSFNGCGTEIRFNIIKDEVIIKLRRAEIVGENTEWASPYGVAAIYQGGFQRFLKGPYQIVEPNICEIRIPKPDNLELLKKLYLENNMAYDPELTRIIIPYDWPTCLIDIEGEITPPRIEQVPSKRYIAYGSSITHGGCSITPGGTYAMRTAQLLGADLINLGFAGSAFLDETIADFISEREDWDFTTLEMGINMLERNWDVNDFTKRIDYFIDKIATRNPEKWIFCIDIFKCSMDFKDDIRIGEFRRIVREKVISLNLPRVVYINGFDIINDLSSFTADLLHPSCNGMEEIANNLSRIIIRHIS